MRAKHTSIHRRRHRSAKIRKDKNHSGRIRRMRGSNHLPLVPSLTHPHPIHIPNHNNLQDVQYQIPRTWGSVPFG